MNWWCRLQKKYPAFSYLYETYSWWPEWHLSLEASASETEIKTTWPAFWNICTCSDFRNIPEKGGKRIISSLTSYQSLCFINPHTLGLYIHTYLRVLTYIYYVGGEMTTDFYSSPFQSLNTYISPEQKFNNVVIRVHRIALHCSKANF